MSFVLFRIVYIQAGFMMLYEDADNLFAHIMCDIGIMNVVLQYRNVNVIIA